MADDNTPSVLSDPSFNPSGTSYGEAATAERAAAGAAIQSRENIKTLQTEDIAERRRLRGEIETTLKQPHQGVPDLEKPTSPPKPEDYQKFTKEFIAGMVLLGAFGGKLVRNAGNAPLKAFTGAMQGWQEGNLQKYKQASEEWEQKQQQLIELNRQKMEKYRAALEDRSLTVQEMMLRYKLVAMENQDRIAYEQADAENVGGVAAHYTAAANATEKMEAATQKMVDLHTQADQLATARANQWRDFLATPNGQQMWNTPPEAGGLTPAQKLQIKGHIDLYADKVPVAPAFDPTALAPGEGTGGVPAVEPPPGTPIDTSTTPAVNLPPDLRGPQPLNMKANEMAARQFRIETWTTKGREPNSAEWGQHYRTQHPPRAEGPMTLLRFEEDFEAEHGRPPNVQEMLEFRAREASISGAFRTLGSREAGIALGVNAFQQTVPLAREASHNVPRTKFVPANELRNRVRHLTSDNPYKKFFNANEAAITEYALAIGRGGAMTVHAQERAASILNTADSDEAYQAGLDQLEREAEAISKAPEVTREQLVRSLLTSPSKSAAPPAPAPGGARGGDGWGSMTVH